MKKTAKFLMVMLTVAVLMAIFCFSAGATEYNWSEADGVISLDSSNTFGDGDVIYVTGKVTVSRFISIKGGANVSIIGVNSDEYENPPTLVLNSDDEYVINMAGRTVSTLNLSNITVDGEGVRRVIRMASKEHILNVNAGTVITGGNATEGGGIFVGKGTVNIDGGTVTGNSATSLGGGIYLDNTTSRVNLMGNATVIGNTLTAGGESNIQNSTKTNESTNCIVVKEGFTGEVGVYAPALSVTKKVADLSQFIVGTAEGSFTGTISGDNVVYTQAIDGSDIILNPSSEVASVAIKNANKNNSKTFSTIEAKYYILPNHSNLSYPNGYKAADFLGFVKVDINGVAEKVYAAGDAVPASEIDSLYAIWVKVDNIGASAKIPTSDTDTSGIKLFANVDKAALEAAGISVKGYGTEGDGYYRGILLGTEATDLSLGLTKENRKLDVTINNDGWASTEYGKGDNVFAVTINYAAGSAHYNKGVAYCGYVEITVGEFKKIIYADFTAPDSLAASDTADYSGVDARSACYVVRSNYINDTKTEAEILKIAYNNSEIYKHLLEVACYPTDKWPFASAE